MLQLLLELKRKPSHIYHDKEVGFLGGKMIEHFFFLFSLQPSNICLSPEMCYTLWLVHLLVLRIKFVNIFDIPLFASNV